MTDRESLRRGAILVAEARDSLRETLGHARSAAPPKRDERDAPWLAAPGASFITLRAGDRLRGCVGSVEATRPLVDDVRQNAVAAALHDRRFPPVEPDELDAIEIEVSLLTEPEPVPGTTEDEILAALRPGIDGVILEWGERRATFLPQVWDSLPDPRDFLARLKQKADLDPDFWHPDLRFSRYRVRKWREADLRAQTRPGAAV